MDILDNQNLIRQRDLSDALGLAAATPSQLRHDFGISKETYTEHIDTVVFAGMGGSALQAELARTWPELKVPFVISKDYAIPAFVNERTLVVVASYSGNTEETLSALEAAKKAGAVIYVMAGGGKLLDIAKSNGHRHAVIPKAVQPRMVAFYSYRMLVELFVAHQLVDASVIDELNAAADFLEGIVAQWVSAVPFDENPAKQLAARMTGKTAIIFAGPLMAPAAYKWKISVNENAKNTAWCNVLPEFDHNEFTGWTSHPVEKPFAVIDLVSSFEHPRVQQRFEVGDRLLSGMRPKANRVDAQGNNPLEHLLYLVLFGDFVTIYLGLLNGLDPSPVVHIEKLKRELGEYTATETVTN
jgi:glucose/mannose-6-phosphate isomerase